MPKIQFKQLPKGITDHIKERVLDRQITVQDLTKLQTWISSNPDAPEGQWYKDFGTFILCGTSEYPKTILEPSMKPFGSKLK